MLFIIIILIVINTIIISIIIINTISIIVIVIFTVTTNVFTTNRLKWNVAKSTRESLRSKLASINSAAEEEAVTALRTPNGWMWIILHRHPNIKRPWLWVDGSRVSYALWNDKDTNKSSGKNDCAHVMSIERRRNKKNTVRRNSGAKDHGLSRPGYRGLWTLFVHVNKQISWSADSKL